MELIKKSMKSLGQTFISNMSCLMCKHPPTMTHCVVNIRGYTLDYKHFHAIFKKDAMLTKLYQNKFR